MHVYKCKVCRKRYVVKDREELPATCDNCGVSSKTFKYVGKHDQD